MSQNYSSSANSANGKIPVYINRDFRPLSCRDQFGIDKLHLFTDEFEIGDINQWELRFATKKAGQQTAEQPHLITAGGQPVYGQKLFVNTPGFTAEIQKDKTGRSLLFVQMNPSGMIHPYHLTADGDQIADTIEQVRQCLRNDLATDVNLLTAKIGRVDIAAQAVMNKPVPDYDQIIRGSKDLKRAPKTEYPNGFLIGNKQRKVCTYDKGLKLLHDSGQMTAEFTNLLRVEPRILNAAAIKAHCSFDTADKLCNIDRKLLYWTYSKAVNGLLKFQQPEIEYQDIQSLAGLLGALTAKYPRQWLSMLPAVYAAKGPLPTANELKAAAALIGMPARTISNSVKNWEKFVHQLKFIQGSYLKDTADVYKDNFTEFTDKFIAQYA